MANHSVLKSVEIGNNISAIGQTAFENCTSLSSAIYNKPTSEISSMTAKYWGLETGTKIYAFDGVITVTGSNTGTFEENKGNNKMIKIVNLETNLETNILTIETPFLLNVEKPINLIQINNNGQLIICDILDILGNPNKNDGLYYYLVNNPILMPIDLAYLVITFDDGTIQGVEISIE